MSITASEARTRLFPLIEEVNDDMAAVEVVGRKGTVFIVPADEYRALLETMYLLSAPANAERLRSSIASVRAGRVEQHDLVDDGASATARAPSTSRTRPKAQAKKAAKAVVQKPTTRAAKTVAR